MSDHFAYLTDAEKPAFDAVVKRSKSVSDEQGWGYDLLSLRMDWSVMHFFVPMDWNKLSTADAFNFAHDLVGLLNHIDRETQTVNGLFLPRCMMHSPFRVDASSLYLREGNALHVLPISDSDVYLFSGEFGTIYSSQQEPILGRDTEGDLAWMTEGHSVLFRLSRPTVPMRFRIERDEEGGIETVQQLPQRPLSVKSVA